MLERGLALDCWCPPERAGLLAAMAGLVCVEAQDACHGLPEMLRAVSREGAGRVSWEATVVLPLGTDQNHGRVGRLPADGAKELVDRSRTGFDIEQDQVERTAREDDFGLPEGEHLQQPHAAAGMPVHGLADQERGNLVRLHEQDLKRGSSPSCESPGHEQKQPARSTRRPIQQALSGDEKQRRRNGSRTGGRT
jgi:hypothetical protein